MRAYLIPGYGIPKDIEDDDNYRRYLGVAFNVIFRDTQQGDKAVIVFSGGKSDCYKPYKRTEAGEMKRMFKKWASRPACRSVASKWRFIAENSSLSTLDNILLSHNILKSRRIGMVTIFVEMTRTKRITSLAHRIYKGIKVKVIPIDFDLSSNRYLDRDFLEKKESTVAKIENRSLKDPKYLVKYRKMMKQKIVYFRQARGKSQAAIVNKWWRLKMNELNPE